MKNPNISRLAYMAACVFFPLVASGAVWIKAETGTYSLTDPDNWNNGTLPTSTTTANIGYYTSALKTGFVEPYGYQILTGDIEVKDLDVITANPVTDSTVRTFTGNITAKRCVIRTGTNEISGTLTLTATSYPVEGPSSNYETYSIVGTSAQNGTTLSGVLDIISGGALLATNYHAFYVPRYPGSGGNSRAASGRIRLRDGGRLMLASNRTDANSGLLLGVTTTNGSSTAAWLVSSYVQDGGFAKIGRSVVGGEPCASSTMTICGGVLDLKYVSGNSQILVGQKGYGSFQQLGGEVYVHTNHVLVTLRYTQPYAFTVGYGLAASEGLSNACFYACGGMFVNGNAFIIQGPATNMTGVMAASATIDGTAVVTSKTVRVGANTGDGQAVLNLNGGFLSTAYLRGYDGGGRLGASEINANGGTVSFPADGITIEDQFLYIDRINIYSGGLTVDCGRNINFGTASIPATLRTPSGLGLVALSRSALKGCIYTPQVMISGGSGSNATAVALVDYNRNVMTGIVVTCCGEGYKAGDELTVGITRASASSASSIIVDGTTKTFAANASGALVKTGTGTLSLYAQPEFEGTYEVREGTMIQTTATTGSEKVSAIVIGGENAVFQCGSANSTATVARSNPVNTNATLTLGTANGPGKLSIPAAANGQSAAFEQTFASLTVSGKGNTIEMASGNAAANGAKVTFGDISCPDGAEVTIPHWKSSFKVYVTGRPARTVFKNVLFAGADLHAAVGPDGQLIPAPGFTLTIR